LPTRRFRMGHGPLIAHTEGRGDDMARPFLHSVSADAGGLDRPDWPRRRNVPARAAAAPQRLIEECERLRRTAAPAGR
jgi:hypothetical protein